MTERSNRTLLPGGRSARAVTSPRVLLLITGNQRRGAESSACVLADELDRRGMRARVLALAPSDVPNALPVETLGPTPLAAATLWNLRREIRSVDVVLACGSRTLPASVLAGLGTGRPVVYQNIGDPLFWAGTPGRRLRVRALLRRTAAVGALTEQSASTLETHFGVPPDRIRVIRNFRSAATFLPATPAEKASARSALGLPNEGATVAIAGALSPEKRVDVAISAITAMPPGTRLVIAGDGPLRAELESQATAQAPGRVSFLGQLTDLAELLRAVDAVTLTSDSEGVPGVLIEAGLSGLPVVATDVGYVRDIVLPGRTGEVVPTGDARAVAQALKTVLADSAALGALARRHCVERFDVTTVSDSWAELLRAVVGVKAT
jgi:glycosyltransferase involved in cell wall biosynthesis